ncbi:hypothetical protein EVAR_44798_1 [Eumeta japonica]|uniref:Ig-like domain-containing protein n=1 Tax=Eumeta variegata TaxID=151549 RepID=A0A4C1X8S6_EUMVA|nr:hypothetical protein EVAR_44798_1 [Eumeta japonica]
MVTLNSRMSVTHNGHNTWKLYIANVEAQDSGSYMCQLNTKPMKSQVMRRPIKLLYSLPFGARGSFLRRLPHVTLIHCYSTGRYLPAAFAAGISSSRARNARAATPPDAAQTSSCNNLTLVCYAPGYLRYARAQTALHGSPPVEISPVILIEIMLHHYSLIPWLLTLFACGRTQHREFRSRF